MLAISIIQKSNSAWSSPTVLVTKKDPILHQLPTPQSGHEGERLPATPYRGQLEHVGGHLLLLTS